MGDGVGGAAHEGAVDAGAVHEACGRLRFSEGLRRRWEQARAESAVQEAAQLSFLEGGRVPAAEIRRLAGNPLQERTPAEAYALGIWLAAWNVEKSLPPLNARSGGGGRRVAPASAVLSGIHRDICSYLVASDYLPQRAVAMPRDPQALGELMMLLRDSAVPALDRYAHMWRIVAGGDMFEVASTPTAVIFAKWFLAQNGVEPTGVSVLSAWAGSNRSRYVSLVAGGFSDEDESWRDVAYRSVLEGCEAGEGIARAVQAGVFPR